MKKTGTINEHHSPFFFVLSRRALLGSLIGGATLPLFLEAGLEGIFSPKLKMHTGYCEYHCTLCGQVCPTADKAIKFRIATVLNEQGEALKIKQPYVIDRLCIGCGICENRCPLTGTAAIRVTSAGAFRTPTNRNPGH